MRPASPRPAPVGLLLAAGRGTRFDPSGHQDKLLARLPDGRALAFAAACNLRSAVDRVVAVCRPDAPTELLALLRDAGCEVIACPQADEGMGRVLSCAVAATAAAPGWVVALGDMPFIAPQTIRAVAAALATHDLVAPVCAGRRGHPVGFGKCCREQLLALSGDAGGRHLIATAPWYEISTDDTGILRDIDIPQDLGSGEHSIPGQ